MEKSSEFRRRFGESSVDAGMSVEQSVRNSALFDALPSPGLGAGFKTYTGARRIPRLGEFALPGASMQRIGDPVLRVGN